MLGVIHCSRLNGRTRGRAMASRITAAKSKRSEAVPQGPPMGKSWMARLAPSWIEMHEPMTHKTAIGLVMQTIVGWEELLVYLQFLTRTC